MSSQLLPSQSAGKMESGRIEVIDYARFFAAAGVVCYHYFFNGVNNGKLTSLGYTPFLSEAAKYGFLGVGLFFMISGYVIFFSVRKYSPLQFLLARGVRLYPCFFAAVLFTSGCCWLSNDPTFAVSPVQLLANLSMVAPLFGHHYIDGVYWTLVVELKFYLLIFLLMLPGKAKLLEGFFLLWPLLIAAAAATGQTAIPFTGVYYTFFAAGGLLAMGRDQWSWKTGLSLLLCFVMSILLTTSRVALMEVEKGVFFSPFLIASVVTAFYVFFLLVNSRRGQRLRLYKASFVGGMTYPLYLLHANFGFIFLNRFATAENSYVLYPLLLLMVYLLAAAAQRICDLGAARLWRKGRERGVMERRRPV